MGIRGKLLLPLLALVIIIIGSVEYYWGPKFVKQAKTQHLAQQKIQLGVLEIALVEPMLNSNLAQIHLILDNVIAEYPEWIQLELRTPDHHRLYPIDELSDVAGSEHVFRHTHLVEYLDSALGTIDLTVDVSGFIKDVEHQLLVLEYLLLLLLSLVAGASTILQERFVRHPMHRLAHAATRIAKGDFDVKLPKPSNDEVGQLIIAFGDMCKMRNLAESALEEMAYSDVLTHLPNRAMLKNYLTKMLANARRAERTVSVLFIDLDRFKVVNDTLGHDTGDKLLTDAAERISSCIRTGDLVARLGGDEFTLVLDEQNDYRSSRVVAERIVNVMEKPFIIGNHRLVISPSIGISLYPKHATDYGSMMQCADTAMYRAKELGGNRYEYYSTEMSDKLSRHMRIEVGLRRAIAEEEFVLYYQPKVELVSGKIIGVEALIRWMDPEQGMIPPDDFIPLAEETGLIIPIGEWVLRKACEQHAEWGACDIELAVNLSANHLSDSNLLDTLRTTLRETGFAPHLLELEITENAIMQNVQQTITILEQIKTLGVKVAIDDFGTGYSSLSYLNRYAIDTIKIDRSFIMDLPQNTDALAITSATIAMAQNLKRRVVAEGVETIEQATILAELGCEMGQGYYYRKPIPASEFAAILSSTRYLPNDQELHAGQG